MALSLFQNFSILVAVISMILEFIRSSKVQYRTPYVRRFVLGTLGGLIGILLLMSTVPINSSRTIIFDFRFVVMYLSAMYGGFTSSVITSAIIAFYRLSVTSADAIGITVSTSILICGFVLGGLSHLKLTREKKFLIMNSAVALTITIASYLIFDDFILFVQNALLFISTTVFTSYFICRYIHYTMANIRNYWQLKIDATTDHLTELANLREFEYRLVQLFEECKDSDLPISFLMLDLDHFKLINDTYGHHKGDEVLSELAQILIKSCRSHDLVARIGGEEFAIVLPHCPRETALKIARRIRGQIEDHVFCADSHEIRMTVSIGVSSSPFDADDSEKLKRMADEALYQAKRSGRNTVMLAQ